MIMKKYLCKVLLILLITNFNCNEIFSNNGTLNYETIREDTVSYQNRRVLSKDSIKNSQDWFKGENSQVFFNTPKDNSDSIIIIIPILQKNSEIRDIIYESQGNYYIINICTGRGGGHNSFKFFETFKIPNTIVSDSVEDYVVRFFSNRRTDIGKQILKKTIKFNSSPHILNSYAPRSFEKRDLPQGFNKIAENNLQIFLVDDVRNIDSTMEFKFLLPCSSETEIESIKTSFQSYLDKENLLINIYLRSSNQTEINSLGYLELDMEDISVERRKNISYFIIQLYGHSIEPFNDDPEVKVIDADIEGEPEKRKYNCK